VDAESCFSCHEADYQGTTSPAHDGHYPTTCGDCHDTASWRPAKSGTHPEEDFPIAAGNHAGIGCSDCHDADRGSPVGGANTDCVGCHTGAHVREQMDALHGDRGVASYDPGPDAAPNFCLSCHPSGQAPRASHPEEEFPITTGNHAGLACTSCHDASRGSPQGGANTSCIDCHLGAHPRSTTDVTHEGRPGYPTGSAPPSFCLQCHPRGTAGAARHPESVFPITTGPHSAFGCSDCHNSELGSVRSENVDCIGCHTGQHANEGSREEHQTARFREEQATGSHSFCRACHPSGSA
jgi:hypothetical protein